MTEHACMKTHTHIYINKLYSFCLCTFRQEEKINLSLSFGRAGSLLLRGLFSSCSKQGLFFTEAWGLLAAVASPVAEHGL